MQHKKIYKNNFAIGIVSIRKKQLVETIKFYKNKKLNNNICVFDGSKKFNKFVKDNVMNYFHFPKLNSIKRWDKMIFFFKQRPDIEYICCLGDDDYFFPKNLSKLFDFLKKNQNVTCVTSNNYSFNLSNVRLKKNEIFFKKKPIYKKNLIQKNSLFSNFKISILTSTSIHKKDFFVNYHIYLRNNCTQKEYRILHEKFWTICDLYSGKIYFSNKYFIIRTQGNKKIRNEKTRYLESNLTGKIFKKFMLLTKNFLNKDIKLDVVKNVFFITKRIISSQNKKSHLNRLLKKISKVFSDNNEDKNLLKNFEKYYITNILKNI